MMRPLLRWAAIAGGAFLALLFAFATWDAWRGPPLEPWHRERTHDVRASQVDQLDWDGYLAAEEAVFEEVRQEVTLDLPKRDQVPFNRYYDRSPVHPANFARDWNHSFVLEPDGAPAGAAVMLHGLTDSPYSLRHIAKGYQERGFAVVAIRMPGHGTVPGALTRASWEDWAAATRLAVREARRLAPVGPLHLVGYSNGGALAVNYALEALDDSALAMPDQLVLFSPMIGITAMARFAGIAAWPSILPAFARSAWLDVEPEYNPFKYNSFPVRAAVQSRQLTLQVQEGVDRAAERGTITRLPPIHAFQSAVDYTVNASALVGSLFRHLPRNGSALVLFDLNRGAIFGPLLTQSAASAMNRLAGTGPSNYRLTLVTNEGTGDTVMVRDRAPGDTSFTATPTALTWPRAVFSLSHLALPFPMSDALYGLEPDMSEDFGIRIGTLALKGEIGVLTVNLGSLTRVTANPFWAYVEERIAEVGAGRRDRAR